MVEIVAEQAFALLYALLSLFSLTSFGYVAETCDILASCPNRLRAIIAFAVFVFLLSTVMLVAQLLRLSFVSSLHLFVSPVLFALNTVVAALSISPRTVGVVGVVGINGPFVFPQEIAWWAELVCVLLVFLALVDREAAPAPKEGLELPTPNGVDSTQPPMAAPAPVEQQPQQQPVSNV